MFDVDLQGNSYIARFMTRGGYNSLRLTNNMFRPELSRDRTEPPPPLRPERVAVMKFRCGAMA